MRLKESLCLVLLAWHTAAVEADQRFRVGVIAPLSGPLAEYGLAAQNGIELARSQNSNIFSKIDFLYEDSQWDAKQSVSAFNKLRDIEKVQAVFNWGNPTTEAVAPIAEQSKLPLIGMTLDPSVAMGRQYVIRSTNSAGDFAAAIGHYLRSQGYKQMGVVIAANTYVQGLFDGLKHSVGNDISIDIIDRYNLGDQDFRATVSKVRARKYDAIGIFLITGQVSSFYRQLAQQGVALPTFGTDFFESSTEIKMAAGGMNGSVYSHLGITEQFRKDYTARFKNDYQIAYAGNAYDMAVVLGSLFNRSGDLTSEQIMSKLKSVTLHKGIGGEFSFVETPTAGPHYHFPVEIKKIIGEDITVVARG
ncbi:MAG: hypothetical protein DCC75_09330 [Proteobacteria bacterium]|nr:MAG: hypothetical protein DCC75_09330 [Pseudomonadota bacterium]